MEPILVHPRIWMSTLSEVHGVAAWQDEVVKTQRRTARSLDDFLKVSRPCNLKTRPQLSSVGGQAVQR